MGVHLDIKLDNLMQDPESGALKLIDFSVAQEDSQKMYEGFYGSLPFAAPELCQTAPWDGKAADIFSVGVVLAFLLDVQALFKHLGFAVQLNTASEEERQLKASELQGAVQALADALATRRSDAEVSAQSAYGPAGDLAARLLSVIPEERPTAMEALDHKWFASLPPVVVEKKEEDVVVEKKEEEEAKDEADDAATANTTA